MRCPRLLRAVVLPAILEVCKFAAALPTTLVELPLQHNLLHYSVDLEKSPDVRFQHVWKDILQKRGPEVFRRVYAEWNALLKKLMPNVFGTSERAARSQHVWLEALSSHRPAAISELQGLSNALQNASGGNSLFELPALATAVSLYPILNTAAVNHTDAGPTSACTSTVVLTKTGQVLHGRSLDYEPRDELANATVVVDFRKTGNLAYRCLNPLHYTTALQWFTCVRPGSFSLSVNARSQGSWMEHNTSFEELLRRATAPGMLLLGEVGERVMAADSFEAALEVLVSSSVVSSNYFVLAGLRGQGAVVTRFGNSSSADVWTLSTSTYASSDGQPSWMRVQTNVDHWVPLSTGAYATHRRQHAIDLLSQIGQTDLNADMLLKTYLTQSPRPGSENRTQPEDTGVILRPTTIATLVLDPSLPAKEHLDPTYWRIWAETPKIIHPQAFFV